MKKLLSLIFVAMISLIVVTSAQAASKKSPKGLTTTQFLTSIDCEHCSKKIMNSIPFQKGVKDVKVDLPTKTVTVTYDPAKSNDADIVKDFAKIKVEAKVVKAKQSK